MSYERDLAYIHDVGFTDYARGAAPHLLELLDHAGIREGTVVDLGCGTGLWARALAEAGYEVVGLDISPAMIEIARERVPAASFEVGSFTAFDPPPCRAVTALGEPLAYLFDGANTSRALLALCRRVYRALEPGGLFIFDLLEPGVTPRGEYELFRQGYDWAIHCRAEEDRRRRLLTRHITTFRRDGEHFRREREVHELRLYRAAKIAAELRAMGFRVRRVRSFGAVKLRAGHTGLIARRIP